MNDLTERSEETTWRMNWIAAVLSGESLAASCFQEQSRKEATAVFGKALKTLSLQHSAHAYTRVLTMCLEKGDQICQAV